jgi:hypothetical protein
MPIDMLSSTYKRLLAKRASYVVTHKGGKGKSKGARVKPRWLPQEAPRAIEEAEFDLLMLPHPTLVHRENETYVLIGHGNLQVRVTKENWNTLRFNTKTWNPEYFPASYLEPRVFSCLLPPTGSDRLVRGWGWERREVSSFHYQRNLGRFSAAAPSSCSHEEQENLPRGLSGAEPE